MLRRARGRAGEHRQQHPAHERGDEQGDPGQVLRRPVPSHLGVAGEEGHQADVQPAVDGVGEVVEVEGQAGGHHRERPRNVDRQLEVEVPPGEHEQRRCLEGFRSRQRHRDAFDPGAHPEGAQDAGPPHHLRADVEHGHAVHGPHRVQQRGARLVEPVEELVCGEDEHQALEVDGPAGGVHQRGHDRDDERGHHETKQQQAAEEIARVLPPRADLLADVGLDAEARHHEEGGRERVRELEGAEALLEDPPRASVLRMEHRVSGASVAGSAEASVHETELTAAPSHRRRRAATRGEPAAVRPGSGRWR